MKFNMGCGHRKLAGYVNVDASAAGAPDQVHDLDQTPWPWPNDCATEVRFIHSLEHMGGDPKVFLAIMRELYRISADRCAIHIRVPHPRHDNFISDPTHVRPITLGTLELFDLQKCQSAIALGRANSAFALEIEVDFEVVSTAMIIDEPFFGQYQRGEIDAAAVNAMVKHQNNIAREIAFELRARKPFKPTAPSAPVP